MTEPSVRVCPRCGEPAGGSDLCAVCSANLAVMRGMLPTRAEWEAAHPVGPPPAEPVTSRDRALAQATRPLPSWLRSGSGPVGKRRPGWTAAGTTRNQVIASVAAIALFAVILFTGSGSGGSRPGRPAGATHSRGPAVTPAPGDPTLASCVAAWNGGRSAQHRRDLEQTVAQDAPSVAVLATYAGPIRDLARVGGGTPVLVGIHVCIVVAHDSVFFRQPDGSWGLTLASAGHAISVIARDPGWTSDHANVIVQLGSGAGPATDAGKLTVHGSSLVVLRSSDLAG